MRLSVVIPSFNQGRFLATAIASVRDHAPPDTELIVMDGGSRDDSVAVLRAHADRLAYWESAPDRGQSDALNRGFARATGDILAWLCADDHYLPGGPTALVEWLRAHPQESWVYGDGSRIDGAGAEIETIPADEPDVANLHNWCCVFTPACFWRRSLWERAGGRVDEALHYTMDWELMLRFARHAQPHHLRVPVTAIRDHTDSKSVLAQHDRNHRLKRNREIARISRRYGGLACYNSVVLPLERLAHLHEKMPARPAWFARLAFIGLHLPLRATRALYGAPKSNLA